MDLDEVRPTPELAARVDASSAQVFKVVPVRELFFGENEIVCEASDIF